MSHAHDDDDVRLVRRFAAERDERAFALLVERYGPLVYSVAVRMLRRREDAEDAFQATFLVLARRAASWRDGMSLAPWLHGVTVRVCLNQRKLERRRRQRIAEAATMVPTDRHDEQSAALRSLVDEELAALPQRYREVLVMCDIEGFARDEVAQKLSLPPGTVSSRLARGRERLKQRLMRQGVMVTAGAAALLTTMHAEAASVLPASLLETTVRNADAFVWGTAAAKSTMSLHITQLAEGAMRAMLITRCKTIVCLFLIVAASMFGGALAPGLIPELTPTATAATKFIDDFNDGNAADADPVTWSPLYPNDGTYDASSGDYVLSPNTGNDILVAVPVPNLNLGDTSIRVQIRADGVFDNTPEGIGVLVRSDVSQVSTYAAGIGVDGVVYVGNIPPHAPFQLYDKIATDLRPTEEDVVLQFDAIGDTLSVFAWRPRESKPTQPLVQVTAAEYDSGTIGLFYDPPLGNGSATFRYVHVADTPIVPEPGSRALCAIGGGLLVGGLLFGPRLRRPRFAR